MLHSFDLPISDFNKTSFTPVDLSFEKSNTLYATHSLHAYAAKFPPQLAQYGLKTYTSPGDVVLDPMAGSGTTLVEARLQGLAAFGYDIDPVACLIAQTKCHLIQDAEIETAYQEIAALFQADLKLVENGNAVEELAQRATLPEFANRDYWFSPPVATSLALLGYHIQHTPMSQPLRNFFWLAFSSLILAKNSVANARDIIHSRHHFRQHVQVPDVAAKFTQRVGKMRKQMADFNQRCQDKDLGAVSIQVAQKDARSLPLADDSVDFVLTSPPYATALNYPRAHFLAVPWMGEVLGTNLNDYKANAPNYIGSEQGRFNREFAIRPELASLSQTCAILQQLAGQSLRHAHLIQRYFIDMQQVLGEISRVLKSGKYVMLVVCPSHIRKVDVPTQRILVELGREVGLDLIVQHERFIDKSKRVLPYIQGAFGNRMNLEFVLVFKKQ